MSPSPLMAGAEPMSHAGSGHGVLVLHGFTGNPQSMRPLAQAFADAGYSVEMPLLPGHGTAVADMLPTRFADYAASAEAAYAELAGRCSSVLVAGLSMGGTLSCWLAASHSEIAGLVLVNPMVEPVAESFAEMMRATLDSGLEAIPGIGSDIALGGVTELSYPETPLAPVLSLFDAVSELSGRLERISSPILLFSSRNDHVVPPSNGDYLSAAVSGPVDRIWLERSFHVATIDYDRDTIAAGAVEFAGRVFARVGIPGA